jgi:hypothetical protein
MTHCSLCQIKEATKTNSHIFPKFMGESMLITKDSKRKGFKISSKDGISKKSAQDTPKEDFLLCPDCESLLDHKYENPFAKYFYNTREYPRSYFTVIIRNRHLYRVYYKLDFESFTKFFYSIIFRASISNHENLNYYKLATDIHEKIRRIILDEIPFESLPLYIFTCPRNPFPTGNFIGAFTYNSNIHFFGVNEFILILDFSSNKTFDKLFPGVYNPKYNSVRVLTLPYNYWNSWIKETVFGTVLDKMYKNKMIEYIMNGLILFKYFGSQKLS